MDEERRATPEPNEPCPCGSGLNYGECCGRAEPSAAASEGEAD